MAGLLFWYTEVAMKDEVAALILDEPITEKTPSMTGSLLLSGWPNKVVTDIGFFTLPVFVLMKTTSTISTISIHHFLLWKNF